MTVPVDPRAARIRRLGVLYALAAGLTVFALGPSALGLGESATFAWWVIPQMAGPLVASIFCFWAARRSRGMEVAAWTYFGIGSGLYFFGNLLYLGFAVLGIDLGFPALPELAYFVMAIFFAVGMARYGKAPPQNTGVQVLTFLLVYGAVTAGCLLLLRDAIRDSAMDEFATTTAFLYPALWFSVASYGLMMLALRDQRDNTVPFAILLVAIFAEASADFRYALDLMSGVYTLGGATAVLWLASAFCLCWSAVEQGLKPVSVAASSVPPEGEIPRIGAQALIPATATGLIMLSASASGAFGASPYSLFAAGLAIVLAAIVGTREYRLISTQRRLTASSKASQAQLAGSERRLASVLQSTSDSVIVLDREWRVRFYNDRAKEQIPVLGAIGIGGRFWDLFSPEAMEAYGDFFEQSMASRTPQQIEAYSSTQDMWFELRTYPTPEGMSLFFRDISEARRIRNEIAYRAHHDFLTGLANRVLFHERLGDAVRQGADGGFSA